MTKCHQLHVHPNGCHGTCDKQLPCFTCTNTIPAIQLAANLARPGRPAPLASNHVPTINAQVDVP